MELFWKCVAAAVLAAILGLTIGKKELSMLLILAASCMACAGVVHYLQPVLGFLQQLETMADLSGGVLPTLLKGAGVALVVEIASLICTDAGSACLGKGLQLLGGVVILYLSMPIFQGLFSLIQEILGQL